MFIHTSVSLKLLGLRRFYSQTIPFANFGKTLRARSGVIASSATFTAAILWYSTTHTLHNDGPTLESSNNKQKITSNSATVGNQKGTEPALNAIVWGSNQSNLLSPDTTNVDIIRTPTVTTWLQDVALRDLALHRKHAACVDARGDIYQWGDGFFGSSSSTKQDGKPVLTLRGKDIIQLQLNESKLFALSASGRVYVLSTDASKQELAVGMPTPSSSPWWSTGWIWGEPQNIDFTEIVPQEKFPRGEKFTSISAGDDHLLALTSTGRTFAHPISKKANSHGQLGFRKFNVPGAVSRMAVELTPKSIADPYASASPVKRIASSPPSYSDNLVNIDDKDIRFCDKLFEVPSLRGIEIAQVATGGRSSYARTPSGRVLGWGANEFGQIGLGSNVTLDTITIPTEIVLWRITSGRARTKCVDINAGGDLACFVVERVDEMSSLTTVDVLMCGNGQWGGLGNNVYSSAQGAPVKAKNVSGLLEYNERARKLEPILPHSLSISPTGHVLLTLDTEARSGPGTGGCDLVVWGINHEYQLGNGKKSSLPVPTTLHLSDGERFMLRRRRVKEVRDLQGKVLKGGIEVEQCAVAGYGSSFVYWKIPI